MTEALTSKKDDFLHEETVYETEEANLGQKKLRRQDSWWSWVMCLSGVICMTIILGCGFCFSIIFPILLDEFKQGKFTTAWVGSLALAAPGLFGPFSGRLTDQFGARVVVICGSLLAAAGLLSTSFVPSLFLMFLTYGVIFGCGSSFVFIALFEIVPRYFVKHRSIATGLITMSVGGGIVLMSPICQALLTAFGWRGTFRGLACIIGIVFLLSWALDPSVASVACEEIEEAHKKCQKSRNQRKRGMLDFSMWRNSSFVILTVIPAFIYVGHTITPIHFARFCEENGVAKVLVVWLYTIIGLASLLARVPGAKLCELIGSSRVYLLFVGVSAISSTLLPLATNWIGVLCFSIFYGLADGMMAIGNILAITETLTREQKAQGFGFFQLWIGAAILCGPPIGGLVADETNSYRMSFFTAGAIEFLGLLVYLLCWYLIKRRSSRTLKITDENECFSSDLLVVDQVTAV